MAGDRNIKIGATPESIDPRVDFFGGVKPFESAVYNKSYPAIWEKAIRCPCRSGNDMDSNSSRCVNCRGYGYVYINPTLINVMGYDINSKPTYDDWSINNAGMVRFSVMAENRLTYMDRVTLNNATSINTETAKTMQYTNEGQFMYTIYQPTLITDVRVYKDLDKPLDVINPSDIKIGAYSLIFPNLTRDSIVSVRYEHKPQYLVIDLPHDIRNISTQENGDIDNPKYPTNVVAKKAHYIFDAPNITGQYVNDNSI